MVHKATIVEPEEVAVTIPCKHYVTYDWMPETLNIAVRQVPQQ
jgi:hypothetical protein